MAGVEEKSLFKRVMFDKENTLNKKEFIISYICAWVFVIVAGVLLGVLLPTMNMMPVGIGLSMSFVFIFMQRLKFLGMNKFIGAAGILLPFNILLFIFLAIKNDEKA